MWKKTWDWRNDGKKVKIRILILNEKWVNHDINFRLPVAALGDKIYKNPEYATDFFKEVGLIAGSINI